MPNEGKYDQQMIDALKVIVIASNIVMFTCMVYFASGLRWSIRKDRSSIIGFGWMGLTIAMDVGILIAELP